MELAILILWNFVACVTGFQGRYRCHCSGGCTGNVEDYDCRGSCEEGFYGRYCQKENVALNKRADQSSSCSPPWVAEAYLAVDGNTTTRYGADNEQHACTCAKGNRSTYWSVDLGQKYTLHDMMVYQRHTNHYRLRGLYVTVDNRECWRWTDDGYPPEQFNVTCNQAGREVTFQVNRTEYFMLCEVIIFVCTDFWYGSDCDKTCNCRDQTEVCDKRTGKCTDCPDGWTGDTCDACSDGNWGTSCKKCGHCETGDICDKTTGHCTQCEIGWELPNCTACADGYWGTSCKKCGHCETGDICDKTTGRCTQCEIGWALPNCTACADGYWGTLCTECAHCETGDICDKTTGHCTQCKIGWELPSCTACSDGYWGSSCKAKCGHCETGHICNKATGHCTLCQTGWELPLCTTCSDGYWDSSCKMCGHCETGDICDKTTGHCTQCEIGRKLPNCTACADDYWGTLCTECAHCETGDICDKTTGHCTLCEIGWALPNCTDTANKEERIGTYICMWTVLTGIFTVVLGQSFAVCGPF